MKKETGMIMVSCRLTAKQKKELDDMARFYNKSKTEILRYLIGKFSREHSEKIVKRRAMIEALKGVGVSEKMAEVIADTVESVEEIKTNSLLNDGHYQKVENLYKEKYAEFTAIIPAAGEDTDEIQI